MEKKRILVVDDHEIIHVGIKDILSGESSYEVIGDAFSGREAVEKALQWHPDIILMDINMPEMNGIMATREIMKVLPKTRIIALSQHDSAEYIVQMFHAGCMGYLLKNARKQEILRALDCVVRNSRYIPDNMMEKLLNGSLSRDGGNLHLTQREIEIIKKISEGKNNTEIAGALFISIRTVETHRRNVMMKLEVSNVVDLIKAASKAGIVNL